MGADAVLLIVAVLSDGELVELRELSYELGMDSIVEVHDEEELKRALGSGASTIGINNRSLRTFVTDLKTTFRLRRAMPSGVIAVSESGIKTRSDVIELQKEGVDAILVGESLMRSPDIGAKVRELMGQQ
jgi:indole-3-glycerol phosphate synthase